MTARVDSPFSAPETEVIRKHWRDCAGYVVAASGACLDIQTVETWGPTTRVKGRTFRPYSVDDLARLHPPRSWFLGVVLCSEDPLDRIVDWYRSLDALDRRRVKFYVHPAFHPSPDLGDTARVVTFAGSWQNFHELFGQDHGLQIVGDHAAGLYT